MHRKYATNNSQARQWHMLLVYNIYRLVCIAVLFGVFWFGIHGHVNSLLYLVSLFAYLIFGLVLIYIWHRCHFKFEQQVILSGTVDIVVMVLLIYAIGYIQSGLVILLNVSVAVLSILAPGRLAIYFASIASCMLLGISAAQYVSGVEHDLSGFFSTGIYGAGFFATALTAWYLASWVRSSESLAQDRAKELASMQRLNEYIVERLHYGVIFVDTTMQVKVINTAARQFLELNGDQKNLNLMQLSLPLYTRYLQFLSKQQEEDQSAQTTIDKPFLQVHFFSASFADQTAVLIILDDMANIARQAQQLKLASLGRFSASIAHELRNPLGIIAHAVQLMGEDGKLNEEDSRLKQLIINNCNRMNNVIKNVLQMSRRQQSKPEPIELTSFLKQFKADFCIVAQCDITLKLPRGRRNMIVFDKSQLEQLLVILCENAAQHGRDAKSDAKITIVVKKEAQQMTLAVCDRGAGIPEHLRNNIFEPFFSTTINGSGMGLFLAKDLCEVNQSRLTLADTESGCCFIVTLNQNNEI